MVFEDVRGVLLLDEERMRDLSERDDALRNAHLIVFSAALIAAALSLLVDPSRLSGLQSVRAAMPVLVALSVVFAAFFALIGFWVLTGLLRLAARVLGGEGSWKSLLRVIGHGYALNVLSWVPVLNFFVWLYLVVIEVKALAVVEGFSTGRAIGAWFLAAAFLLVLLFVVFAAAFLLGVASGLGTGVASQL